MLRASVLGMALTGTCTPGLPPAGEPATAPVAEPAPSPASPAARPATAATATSADEDAAWDPLKDCEGAKEDEPCPPHAGYCVLDWGEPGGHSEALWCTEGTWVLEREVNLP